MSCKTWTLSKNKSIELQIDWCNGWTAICGFNFNITTRRDHPGAALSFEILKLLYIGVVFYDHRHWDHENNTYQVYTEDSNV